MSTTATTTRSTRGSICSATSWVRLDAWHQPQDLWGTVPSTHETFRLIAEVPNSSDPARYRPTLPPNTHRSHRPDAGTL
ncbi:DUF7003 family protein [Streptomyces mirabilis]|uniref:DUF7003 family protein n=1 Tax=Streptomyces mirabilis TaxID=68239 RepID=UPI0036E372CC